MARVAYTFVNTDVRVRYSLPWDKAQTLPGGATYEASQEATRAAFHFVREAILANHTRTGVLAGSMRTDMDKRGSKVVRGLVRAKAEHAGWFFHGTPRGAAGVGRIYPDGKWLNLGDQHTGREGPVVRSVAGQERKFYLLQQGAAIGVARVAAGSSIPRGVQVRW